jgi:Do/DeqQ family serine protease
LILVICSNFLFDQIYLKKKNIMRLNVILVVFIVLLFQVYGCGQNKPDELPPVRSIDNMQAKALPQNQIESAGGELMRQSDFRIPAKKVMPAVVHIISSLKRFGPSEREWEIPDFFRDFFGDRIPFDRQSPERQPVPRVGSGSGVIITDDGYILTNNHVVDDADSIRIVLGDRRSYLAKVVGTDPQTDLALLKIEAEGLPYVIFGNSDLLEVGEWVLAVGNPFNLSTTVTAGIVSAKARNINIIQEQASIEAFIQTDAAVNRGNSGGALVNLDGKLVGINTAIASPTGAYAGYSFAIPVNIARKIVDDLLNYGLVQRAYLGVFIRDVNAQLAEEMDLESLEGVYIDSIIPGGSADQAGLTAGGVIKELDGEKITNTPRLQEIVSRHRPGDQIKVVVDYAGKIQAIEVKTVG